FVLTGTTGVAQPCDVGIQRPLKLAIKELQHEDIITEPGDFALMLQGEPSVTALSAGL
ncbi:hypothetical protein BDN67DRAFT_909341, partial [Paxillus ammoniavirescens]